MRHPVFFLISCLIMVPLFILVGGEWGELYYMKYFSQRHYSFLDQGSVKTFFHIKHCYTVTDKKDPNYNKVLTLTRCQEDFLISHGEYPK